jgi:hypothetical protein
VRRLLWDIDCDSVIATYNGAAKSSQQIRHDVYIGDIWNISNGRAARSQQRGGHEL